MVGRRLSHYKIVGDLGRGGMGIVYRAEDTKLDRTVALKVLPAAALASEDDRARFYREAKSAAQLHHPYIASVFEIDEAVPEGAPSDEKRPFIAMEFIDGEPLDERVKAGPMKLDEAVRIATQVAQALEAAHEKHIVHRDVKAANVMLTRKGDAKVLDFGLAKTTHSTMLTRMGSTVGTIAYMSPEQTRGTDVDHRSDLWSLGVLLYELIAGRLPFAGDYEQAVTYSILNEDPEPLTAIRTGVPMGLEWIVTKLLAKDPKDRYQSATEVIVDLRTVNLKDSGLSRATMAASVAERSSVTPTGVRPASLLHKLGPPVGWIGLGALVVAAIAWWVPARQPTVLPSTPKRLSQSIPAVASVSMVALSKQGDRVAYATDVIKVLDLKTGRTQTFEPAGIIVFLDFSQDGRTLLVTTAAGIERLNLETGAFVHVTATREGGPRASWVSDDYIVYEEGGTVFGYSLTTSESRQIVVKDSARGEYDLDYPTVLPDGRTLMATAEYREGSPRIGFWDLESGRNLGYLNFAGYRAQYLEPGYIVFSADGDALAVPFDERNLTQTGPVISIEKGVDPSGLSVAEDGTLVHAGTRIGVGGNTGPVIPVVIRASGTASGTFVSGMDGFPSDYYRSAVIHPDGQKAAIVIEDPDSDDRENNQDIWILDFTNGSRRPLTRGGTSDYPAWSVTGDSILFINTRGNDQLLKMDASGRGGATLIMESAVPMYADLSVSPDGHWAVMAEGLPSTIDVQSRIQLWDFREKSPRADINHLQFGSPNGNPRQFSFAPSGRYFAYEDQGAVYVQSIEDMSSAPYFVWENAHAFPRWAPDESSLYALQTNGGVPTRIPIQTDPVFSVVGEAEELIGLTGAEDYFDVFPEGDLFLTAFADPDAAAAVAADTLDDSIDLHFIINLQAELAQ